MTPRDELGQDRGRGIGPDHVHQPDGRSGASRAYGLGGESVGRELVSTEGSLGRGVGLHHDAVTVDDQDGRLVGVEEVSVQGLGRECASRDVSARRRAARSAETR